MQENKNVVKLGDFLGSELEENFIEFDLTVIQEVLSQLKNEEPIDLVHAEMLQQKALRAADIISEFLGKIIKTTSYLETKINSAKNKSSLEYKNPDGGKTTTDMKIWASSNSPEVEDLQIKLAKAKGSKSILEKKYDILIRQHHLYKESAAGLRKTILGYTNHEKIPEGYE